MPQRTLLLTLLPQIPLTVFQGISTWYLPNNRNTSQKERLHFFFCEGWAFVHSMDRHLAVMLGLRIHTNNTAELSQWNWGWLFPSLDVRVRVLSRSKAWHFQWLPNMLLTVGMQNKPDTRECSVKGLTSQELLLQAHFEADVISTVMGKTWRINAADPMDAALVTFGLRSRYQNIRTRWVGVCSLTAELTRMEDCMSPSFLVTTEVPSACVCWDWNPYQHDSKTCSFHLYGNDTDTGEYSFVLDQAATVAPSPTWGCVSPCSISTLMGKNEANDCADHAATLASIGLNFEPEH